jgi:2-dehydro-3-deoxyphosphogluconate aldolase / (4S)-4-hydroxy-2-oxoglutarate aldolase
LNLSDSHDSSPSREKVLATIRRTFLIPVVRVDGPEQAACAAEGVVLGGHPLIEMTLTIPGALKIIEHLATRYGDSLFVGAGTVMDLETCRAAIQAGASFIVSPSTDPKVIELAREGGVVSMPGALTPTEVALAWQAGADLVKIFPADTMGGPSYLRTLKAPFPEIELIPSGGVSMSNLAAYKSARATAVCMGGLIFEPEALRTGRKDVIAENIARVTAAIRNSEAATVT